MITSGRASIKFGLVMVSVAFHIDQTKHLRHQHLVFELVCQLLLIDEERMHSELVMESLSQSPEVPNVN